MNRAALGLAVGAGYVLGRTKKMKLAFAVGTMVAGKRLKLSPRALAELVSTQLEKNPQFKELGGQLRQDLRGVGTAATGALVERQIEGLAGRLHSRTQGVQDRISGVAPDAGDVRDAGERATGLVPGRKRRDEDENADTDDGAYEDERDADDDDHDDREAAGENDGEAREETRGEGRDENGRSARSGKSSSNRRTATARKTATGDKSGTARTAAAKKTPARKTAAKSTDNGKATGGAKSGTARAPRTAKKTASSATRGAKGGRGRG
ncbi:DNA primase [Streptomyces sp. NPDC102406]|uniref:DNA primase n=1 Tax=Streptomyces sp. NPDC102406 TaxID=3366171 RepID=UPI0037FB1068